MMEHMNAEEYEQSREHLFEIARENGVSFEWLR